MKLAALAIALVATLTLLWGVGEFHRRNCINSERGGCSVLPWDNGHSTALQLTPQRQRDLCVEARAMGYVPPEECR